MAYISACGSGYQETAQLSPSHCPSILCLTAWVGRIITVARKHNPVVNKNLKQHSAYINFVAYLSKLW